VRFDEQNMMMISVVMMIRVMHDVVSNEYERLKLPFVSFSYRLTGTYFYGKP